MKRLNRKGFTLVELLAVIVILAIVVGIALTTVLPTLKSSRQKAFDLTANTAADYLEKQYQLEFVGDLTGEEMDAELFPGGIPKEDSKAEVKTITEDQIKAAGLKPANYDLNNSTWYITSSDRACVTLKASKDRTNGAQYYDVEIDEAKSDGC